MSKKWYNYIVSVDEDNPAAPSSPGTSPNTRSASAAGKSAAQERG